MFGSRVSTQNITNISIPCVIPAAGHGLRWAPISKYFPKEMLPLVNKPAIDIVINEAILSGCNKIILIINQKKDILKEYLTKDSDIPNRVKIEYVYQENARGLADAIMLSKPLVGEPRFAVMMPDMPALYSTPLLKQLINGDAQVTDTICSSALAKYPQNNDLSYGKSLMLKEDGNLAITHFCTKSKPCNHPDNKLHLGGRLIFSTKIYNYIEETLKALPSEEVNDTIVLQRALDNGEKVIGIPMEGHVYDIGTPSGYIKTNIDFLRYNDNKLPGDKRSLFFTVLEKIIKK